MKVKNAFLIFVITVFLSTLSYCLGSSQNIFIARNEDTSAQKAITSIPTQKLILSVTTLQNNLLTQFTPEELNNQVDYPLMYYGLKDVNIVVEGTAYPLHEALRDDIITLPLLFAYARLDANNSFCTERCETINGLTSFYYGYPEYDIKFVYDVYETADGGQHLINDISLYKKDCIIPRYYTNENGTLIDREDWGLEFEVNSVTSNCITIECTQTAGQQIGVLTTQLYYIVDAHSNKLPTNSEKEQKYNEMPKTIIKTGCSTRFIIDWTNTYGNLPPGKYKIFIQIHDMYDDSETHPLIRNFYDDQVYQIDFSIS